MRMDKKEIFGWLLMFGGIASIYAIITLNKNPGTTIGTVFCLVGVVVISIPCLIVGSILNGTAPEFIMTRLR